MAKTYETNSERVFYAFIIGSLTGSTVFPTSFTIPILFEPHGLNAFFGALFFGFVFWLLGLLLIGSPIWLILHRLNMRKFYHAALAGFLPLFLFKLEPFRLFSPAKGDSIFFGVDPVGKFWEGDVITWHHLETVLKISSVLGMVGALVTLAVWRTAYRVEDRHDSISHDCKV